MAYADKRDGKITGAFVGEWPKGRKKRRFKTLQDAKDYETFCKLMGREPPTITDDLPRTGAPTFAEVAQQCKAAGGPRGLWKRERDCSIIPRVDYCVDVVGTYEITHIYEHAQDMADKIAASLDKVRAPGKRAPLSNATKNRYLNAFGAVLTYAHKRKRLIPARPELELLDETTGRRERDALSYGQEEVILKLMRDNGDTVEALCVEALLETGFRSGELLKLSPDQITVEQVPGPDGSPSVPVGVIRLRKEQVKNNRSRVVAFSAELAQQIRALVASKSLPNRYRLLDAFKLAVKRAGYKGNLVIHSLRHTRVTRLRKAGVDEAIRMKLVGHTGKDVHHGYDHVDLEDQLEVAKKLLDHAGKRGQQTAVVPFPKSKSA